uniref:Orf2 n=1 Tax=Drosophila melanogaster TaxID=7227 RepID=Q3S1N0_DROME|nr:hypothetical protein 2 - fruit fly (Drosophila melanogaster) [Drosophila melanogaster]AAA14198.2 Orf2 [Drosophila melanogaster]CAA48714.1 T-element [Drosophila melanogaster]
MRDFQLCNSQHFSAAHHSRFQEQGSSICLRGIQSQKWTPPAGPRLQHQCLCSQRTAPPGIAPLPPHNTDAELPPWKIVPQSRRAPPILVNDVKEIVPLLEKLNYTAGVSSYTTRAIEGNGVRIQAKDMTAYNKIKEVLVANGLPLFTNQPKSERGFRVIIRHLHHSTPCSWIVEELLKLGFQARFVRNMTNPATGGPMRMFEVEIVMAKDGSHDKILSLKQIGGQRVDIERKNRTREPVQCYRCQGFRHAKNSCMRPPRCMKSAGEHLSSCCTKPRTTPATCVNCSGQHISAYKGCPAYKAEKQKLAANNVDINKIRTIKDATNNFYKRQGPPLRNNTPRLPHSSAILSKSIAEARQEAARKSMLNPFRQNINDRRPRFSSHDTAIQKRLNKWRRNTNKIPKKGRIALKDNAKPRPAHRTSNPAQRHLEDYQDMLRRERSEENDQESEKGTPNTKQVGNDSPPTTSRAARASFKPRIIDDTTPSPKICNPNSQKGLLDDPTTSLANRVDNLEKKIDILMALIIQGRNNNLDMDTSN